MIMRELQSRACVGLVVALLAARTSDAQTRSATLAIVNAHVVTVDSAKPTMKPISRSR